MRLCLVTHKFVLTDGQGKVNTELARRLAARGHALTLVASEFDPAALGGAASASLVKIHTPAFVKTQMLRDQYFAVAAAHAVRTFRDRGPGVVHLNGAIAYTPGDINTCHFVHSDWVRSPWHPSRQHPGVWGAYQLGYSQLNARWEHETYHRDHRIVAVSSTVAHALGRHCSIPAQRIHVIEPGVDTDLFAPASPEQRAATRAALNIPQLAPVAVFVGDIRTNRKNLDLVLAALPAVAGLRLLVVGDATASPYPDRARQLAVADRVHFLGKRADVPAILAAADIMPFPSHYDTFALVVTEAMACALAVVTTPTTGASGVIRDGHNGFVLRHSNDLAGMTTVLNHLVADPAFRARIAANARETATSLSWDNMALRHEPLYAEAMSDRARHARRHALVAGGAP